MPEETKSDEILEAINAYADHNEKQLDSIRTDIQQFQAKTEKRFDQIENIMVTKDYLDDKMSDMKGDLVVLMRKEDKKLAALVEILKDRKLIDDNDIKKILAMEPFPKTL